MSTEPVPRGTNGESTLTKVSALEEIKHAFDQGATEFTLLQEHLDALGIPASVRGSKNSLYEFNADLAQDGIKLATGGSLSKRVRAYPTSPQEAE